VLRRDAVLDRTVDDVEELDGDVRGVEDL